MSVNTPQFDCRKIAGELFAGDLRLRLEEFDRKRKNCWITGLVIFAVSLALLFFVRANEVVLFTAIAGMVIGAVVIASGSHNRRKFYRCEIVPVLVKALLPDLKFSPEKGLSQSKFRSFDLFGSFDRYSSEDHLTGTIGKTAITAAEVHIENRHRDKDGKTYYTTIFRGVIFIADFNKNFRSRTAVLPDTAEKLFGKLIGNFLQQMNIAKSGKLVKLENPEFEKKFAVYSQDPMEARYILTPQLMERLLKVQAAESSPIRVLFMNNNMILAFSRSSGWLEPPSWSDLANAAVLEKTLYEVSNLLELVEELDLNTRIWSKQ